MLLFADRQKNWRSVFDKYDMETLEKTYKQYKPFIQKIFEGKGEDSLEDLENDAISNTAFQPNNALQKYLDKNFINPKYKERMHIGYGIFKKNMTVRECLEYIYGGYGYESMNTNDPSYKIGLENGKVYNFGDYFDELTTSELEEIANLPILPFYYKFYESTSQNFFVTLYANWGENFFELLDYTDALEGYLYTKLYTNPNDAVQSFRTLNTYQTNIKKNLDIDISDVIENFLNDDKEKHYIQGWHDIEKEYGSIYDYYIQTYCKSSVNEGKGDTSIDDLENDAIPNLTLAPCLQDMIKAENLNLKRGNKIVSLDEWSYFGYKVYIKDNRIKGNQKIFAHFNAENGEYYDFDAEGINIDESIIPSLFQLETLPVHSTAIETSQTSADDRPTWGEIFYYMYINYEDKGIILYDYYEFIDNARCLDLDTVFRSLKKWQTKVKESYNIDLMDKIEEIMNIFQQHYPEKVADSFDGINPSYNLFNIYKKYYEVDA